MGVATDKPATPKQLAKLRELGAIFAPDITKQDASDLIRKAFLETLLSLEQLERFDPSAGGKSTKTERRFCCPKCGDQKPIDKEHRSLSANTSTGKWHCHRCDEAGTLREYFKFSEKQQVSKVARARAAAARIFALPKSSPAPKPEPTAEAIEKARRWRETWEAARELPGTPGAAYIEGRSIPLEVATASGVRFSPEWYGRPAVLFPIRDRAGDLVAVCGRFTDGREDPKTMAGGQKSAGVFEAAPGAIEARCLAICEGPFDALTLAAAGVAAIALIGVSWPDWLPQALAFRSVLIATDADKAGDETAAKLASELATRGTHTLRLRPKGLKDWGEWPETRNLEFLRMQLRGFSSILNTVRIDAGDLSDPLTADDVRICAAREMAKAGRIDEARFIARLIDDQAIRQAVERQIGQ